MTSRSRPTLEDAARQWLGQSSVAGATEEMLRQALSDFVEKRFRGAAQQLREIHAIRSRLLGDSRPLHSLHDGPRRPGDGATVGAAAKASAPSDQGRLLFHLVRWFTPDTVVELGTNLGISAAYIALGLRFAGKGRLTTIEQSSARLAAAGAHLEELDIDNVDLVEGDFDDALPRVLGELERVDMAFIDGNHAFEATLRYAEQIRAHMDDGVLVLDDIRWSDDMLAAWNEVRNHPDVGTVVDLGRTGVVVLSATGSEQAKPRRRQWIRRRRS